MSSYDCVPYPTSINRQFCPGNLATARGLQDIERPEHLGARILEIGGGDGLNLLAAAAADPNLRGLSFDLAGTAVERGRRWAEAAGITNVELRQLDILDAADGAVTGEWDFIVAHGVYAWVPEPVREAMWRLIARVLAPAGVAYVSYNAMPGGHLRLAMREMLLHHLQGVDDPAERIAQAKALLRAYAEQADSDEPIVAAMRGLARSMAERVDGVLHHDELGEVYAPQSLAQVSEAAERHGLKWLGEAAPGRLTDGFGPDDQAELVRAAQLRDYLEGRYFRQSLFVRAELPVSRRFDPQRVAPLWAGCHGRRTGETEFTTDQERCEVSDPGLIAALDRLIASYPARIRCGELFGDDAHLDALFRMFDAGLITLHAGPAPCATEIPERPTASPLARMQLREGWPAVATLDHRTLAITDERARAFIQLLDGSRDRAELERDWAATGHADQVPLDHALEMVRRSALLAA
jgi:SAM-dependent methyltransferase